ncbi:MAG: LolA-related protein [Pseudomonadota bacterium]
MPDLNRIRAVVGAALLLAASAATAGDWKLPALMQLLAQNKAGKAIFVEKKYIAIIDKPIESSGELAFTAPDRLEKRTLKPNPELLILEGDNLTIDQPGKRRRTVNLQAYPEVSAFVESIRGTLAGDRSMLEQVYTLELTGSAEKWQLVLAPTQARMLDIVNRIRIGGSHADVKTIDFEQADGDRSEMVITKVSAR